MDTQIQTNANVAQCLLDNGICSRLLTSLTYKFIIHGTDYVLCSSVHIYIMSILAMVKGHMQGKTTMMLSLWLIYVCCALRYRKEVTL